MSTISFNVDLKIRFNFEFENTSECSLKFYGLMILSHTIFMMFCIVMSMIISEDTRKYQPANKRRDPDHVFLRLDIYVIFNYSLFSFFQVWARQCVVISLMD